MKGKFKRFVAAVVMCACILPAGAVGVSAADEGRLVNLYDFEGASYLRNSTDTVTGGVMGGAIEKAAGVGSNTGACAKITGTTQANFYDLTQGGTRGATDNGKGNYIKVENPENKYIRVDAKIFVTDDGFDNVTLGHNYNGPLTTDSIKKSDLRLNAWNDVTFVSTFEFLREDAVTRDDGKEYPQAWYTIKTDMIVNGVMVRQDTKLYYNTKYNQLGYTVAGEKKFTDDDRDRFYLTLLLRGSNFTAYLDDVKTTAYAENNFTWGTLINNWSFEKDKTYMTNDRGSISSSYVGGTGKPLTAATGIGGRSETDTSARLEATGLSTFLNLNNVRPEVSAVDTYLDLYDLETNPYQMVTFDIYPEKGENLTLSLANSWGGKPRLTEMISVTQGKWNTVAMLIKLYDKKEQDNRAYFGAMSDVYVNGERISDSHTEWPYNSFAGTDDSYDASKADNFATTLAIDGTDYVIYLDNIKVVQKYGDMKSESEGLIDPATIAPKLVDNSLSKVSGDSVRVVSGTTAEDLSLDISGTVSVMRDEEFIENTDALQDGDVLFLASANGNANNQYTVSLFEKKLVASKEYRIAYGNNYATYYGKTNYAEGKAKALEATKYIFTIQPIDNTTGETVNALQVIALYEADGTLVKLNHSKLTIQNGFEAANTQVRMDLTEDDLKEGRYIKGIIFNTDNFAPILPGSIN